MNIGYVIIAVIAGMAYFVTGIPTPDEMLANFQNAQRFYTSGAYDQALLEYQRVIDVDSRYVEEDLVVTEFGQMKIPVQQASLYKVGQTYFKMIQVENENIKSMETAEEKEKSKKIVSEYAELSTQYFEMTEQRTAVEELKAQSHNSIINTWYEVLDYTRVIEEGNELISLYPNSSYVLEAMYNIGWAYYDMNDYDKSIDAFTSLINRYPAGGYRSDRALYQVGECYYEKGEFKAAIPFYQRLVEKTGIDKMTDQDIQRMQRQKLAGLTDETALEIAARAQLKIGACYANIGDFDGASSAYKNVAVLFRFDKVLIAQAYQNLADMYYNNGDFDASINAYRDAIDEVPDKIFSARMQQLIAKRYYDASRYSDAVREIQAYIQRYSDVALRAGLNVEEAIVLLARSYSEVGDELIKDNQLQVGHDNLELAISQFDRLIAQFPDTNQKQQAYFYHAMTLMRFGDDVHTRAAIEKFQQLLTEYPETPYAEYTNFFIARAYQSLKDYDNAIASYLKIVDEYPDSPQLNAAWMEIAVAYRSSDREAQSLEYFLKVTNDDPPLFITARLLAAQYLLANDRNDEVVRVVTEAVADTSKIDDKYRLSQLYIIRGNANKNLNNFDQALVDYTLGYDLNIPQTREMAAVFRAGVYIDQEQYARAEGDLRELMKSSDANVSRMAQIRLAIISIRQNKREQAISTYLGLYNSTVDVDEKLGYLRNLQQLSSMSDQFNDVIKYSQMMLDSSDADGKMVEDQFYYKEEAYFNQVLAYEKLNDFQKAKDTLVEGYEKFPDSYFSSDMLIKLGIYYLKPDNLGMEPGAIDIAAEYFDKYVKAFPNTPYTETALYYLGLCYYNGRRFDETLTVYTTFISQFPQSEFVPEAYYFLADSNYNLGNLDQAIAGFDTIISKFPGSSRAEEALYTKAWALMDLENEAEAIHTLEQLVDKFSDSPLAPSSLYSIADYYYNQGDYQQSLDMYTAVLERYPDSEVSKKVPDTLKDIKETIAYMEYEKALAIFDEARQMNNDKTLYLQAAQLFEQVADSYPLTESEIGSLTNGGMCYEELGNWQKAVEMFNRVIRRFEDGANVGSDAYDFAQQHRDYIQANYF